ncbi:MAG: hypothetical protein ABR589_11590, partial [Chthoniobacterales bacterium]
MSPDKNDPLTRLSAELEDLRNTIKQLRDAAIPSEKLSETTDSQARQLAQRLEGKLTALRAAMRLVQREISTLEARLERTEREASLQKGKRAEVTAQLNERERRLKLIEESAIWKSIKPVWKLLNRSRRQSPSSQQPVTDLVFGLDAPSEWKTSSEILVIKGWCA